MNFKKRISRNSVIYLSSLAAIIILTIIVFLMPVEFSSYKISDTYAPFWYLITETGGFYGGSSIIILLLIYLLIYFKKFSKLRDAYIFISLVFLIQVIIAGNTLFYTKGFFQNPRPSQLFFIEKNFVDMDKKEFLYMAPVEKRKYLQRRLDSLDNKFEDIYPPILNSWIYDSGYSFPSGHSQTSFFLGTILAFVIYKLNSKKYYFLIPFVWAILVALSRVVIGIHYPIDVAAGGFIGLVAAFIIITLKKVNIIFENFSA